MNTVRNKFLSGTNGVKMRASLFVMPIFLLAWFFVLGGTARAETLTRLQYEGGWNYRKTIVTQTLTPDKNPYYIDFSSGMSEGAVLTIEPGVVIKFGPWYMDGGYQFPITLSVNGQIKAQGTADNPVVFTSIYDDTYAGDSNGDGNATSPAAGDWGGFQISSSGNVFENVIIKYGGADNRGLMTFYTNADNRISSSTISHNSRGVVFSAGSSDQPAIIENSDISYTDLGNAITVFSSANPIIRHNNLHNNQSGIVVSDQGVPTISDNNIFDNINYGVSVSPMFSLTEPVDARNNWWGDDSGPYHQTLNPQGQGDKVSDQVSFDPWTGQEKKIEPVIIVPGIMGSWNVSGAWELDPIFHTYDNLWQALINAGYEENKTLFAFPYQWRLSNNYTAELLKQKIQEVKDICHCSKVDLVAHSMGGLVARSYIEGNDYQNDIDQLIFLAAPHKGSTKIYLTWEAGEFGQTARDFVFERILTVEADFNGFGSLFSYVKKLPMQSVQELLPIYNYLRDKDTMILRTYPNNYPVNTFLELLNNPLELQKLDGVRMMNILADAGAGSTIENLRVISKESSNGEWTHGYPENYSLPFTDHGIEYGPGDNTVSERSNKDFNNLENIIINSDHSNIVTDAQKRIIKELTGVEPDQEVKLNMFQKFFLVRIFSPADFMITAPDGKRLGKNLTSNPAAAINEIPGAFYSGFDSVAEFAVIPDPVDGEYKVELQGTGQGEYKLSASLIDDSNQVDQEFSGNIQTGQDRNFTIDYVAQAAEPISALQPADTVPPLITINKPVEGSKYLHSDNLIIDYNATDDFSGLATTSITIDGLAVATTTVDLFGYQLGKRNLIIKVIDNAGNQAQAQVNFTIIADIDSTISDINEIYNRGWLKGKIYRPLLIGAFKLLEVEAKYFDKEKELTEKFIKKTQDDKKLSVKQKQKLIEQYNKKLADLKKNRAKAIDKSLDIIEKLLNTAKRQNQINQQGYGIIINDINYLRINL